MTLPEPWLPNLKEDKSNSLFFCSAPKAGAIVFIILQILFAIRAVLKIGEYFIIH